MHINRPLDGEIIGSSYKENTATVWPDWSIEARREQATVRGRGYSGKR
jgi:hypothetical protein